jgi:Spy/CpxP family protein refolding chaperone
VLNFGKKQARALGERIGPRCHGVAGAFIGIEAPVPLPCCPARTSSGGALFRPSAKEDAMRTLMAVVALMAGNAVYAALPTNTDEKTDQKATGGLSESIQDLNLTEEQEGKITDIRKEYRPKIQETGKELATLVRDEVEKIRAVLTAEQKQKLPASREERKERRAEGLAERIAHVQELELTNAEVDKIEAIRKEYRPKIENVMQGLRGILTDEQKKAREEGLKAGEKRREVLASLNLTDEQKERVVAVGKEVGSLVREETEKMRDVLSEGQKEKLQEFGQEHRDRVRDRMAHRIANLQELNLTDEQKSQIAEIRKEYRPKVHEAGNKLRAAVREEVEMIVNILKG